MRRLFQSNFRAFHLLNATQFLGALNDNIFKLLVIFLLITARGPEYANTALSLAGAIFVIPFLLFSSAAGVLADKISKQRIIVFAKCFELLTMVSACIIIYCQWDTGLYVALFFLATHSALFGPSKYGIIPEIVEQKMVSRANGSITSFTYLAIILGTFIAPAITQLTNENFLITALFCTGISIIGLCTSLGITHTEAGRSTKKINPLFPYEIYQTLKLSWNIPNLLPCICGSSFFLFLGAFMQLNIIPFAMEALGMSKEGGAYLFLLTAIGIAIGAFISGKIAKESIEPGLSCLVGFSFPILLLLISLLSSSLVCVVIVLILMGIVGGTYLIPFDSYLQVNSPPEKRGQIIATSNFFSFIGVLMAAIYLYIISGYFQFSAASGFFVLSIISLITNYLIASRLSSLFFPFLAKKVFKRFRRLHLMSPLPETTSVVILQSNSWLDAILLYTYFPNLHIFVVGRWLRTFPWINGLVDSVRILPRNLTPKREKILHQQIQRYHAKEHPVCLFMHREGDPSTVEIYEETLKAIHVPYIFARIRKEKIEKKVLGIRFSQKHINLKLGS
jgi:acyl-[acyl-carrier-protein]-phospholipid O-acyltransferase/long-chain-fatty-acid--[acyl-carrier-protein] ligase